MATATFQSILPHLASFSLPSPLDQLLGRALGFTEIERIYGQLRAINQTRSITDRLLDLLKVSYTASAQDLARIPRSGAVILTANHPFGILEGAILASLLGRLRSDVKFLANGILTVIPEVREMVIPVDPISGRAAARANRRGIRQSLEHLRAGGLLVIFPAGEVSHFCWKERGVIDSIWNPIAGRLAEMARAQIVPAFINGRNGLLFQLAGMTHPRLRTVLLGRELLNKRRKNFEIRIGAAIPSEKITAIPEAEQAGYLRWRTYLLSRREQFRPHTSLWPRKAASAGAPIREQFDPRTVADEVATLPRSCKLASSGELEVYLARAAEIPCVLHELGRLREITFRAAGEGTGKALDLDEFDAHYMHLFVWHSAKQELVGAYRLARTDLVRKRFGVEGLYTATLFRYGDPFLDRLGSALELGRSFVRQEYQKGFAPLLLLWKGIGAYIARNPECRILFGPVSISNRYEAISRELMVSFLEKYARLNEWAGLVRNRRAFRERHLKGSQRPAFPESGLDMEDLSAIVSEVEQVPTGVPVLLRQYLRLGGKLLSFNVDPKFANSLDGLILVDLTHTEPKLLNRYFGRTEAAKFFEYQKGIHATH